MRLTKKYDDEYESNESEYTVWQKLGQLEDIEDELGIDLIALFKILKTKECYSKEDGECLIMGINKNGVILMPKKFPFGECEFTAPFAELGKTWALTKEDFLVMAKKGLKHMEI